MSEKEVLGGGGFVVGGVAVVELGGVSKLRFSSPA